MFVRITVISLALLFASLLFLFYEQASISQEDLLSYHQLVSESKDLRSKKILEIRPGVQIRENVEKFFSWPENDSTIPIKIFANRSELRFLQKKRSFEIQEKLFGIHAWMQNNREFVAEEGIYSYPEQKLTTYQATLTTTDPDGQIECPKIEMYSSSNKNGFQVICFEPKGFLREIKFTSDQLIFYPNSQTAVLIGNVTLIQNENITATGDTAFLSSTVATLDGHVALNAMGGIGLAEKITINPQTKEILLSAGSSKRVLFQKDLMKLSAPEITIEPKTNTVKGNGKVRFSFTLEEENEMDKLLKRFSPS